VDGTPMTLKERISADLDRLIISLSDLLIGIWACRRSNAAPSGYPQ